MVTPMAFKYNSFLFENYHIVITKNTGGQVLFPMSPLLFSYNVTAGKSSSYFRLLFSFWQNLMDFRDKFCIMSKDYIFSRSVINKMILNQSLYLKKNKPDKVKITVSLSIKRYIYIYIKREREER